jgi:hypothetical protein
MKANLSTEAEFRRLCAVQPQYYDLSRWPYHEIVMARLRRLDTRRGVELGPYLYPCLTDSVVVDRRDTSAQLPTHKHVRHDLDRMPWPFADGEFTVGVMLQVLEHLERPHLALQELLRVAKSVVVSVPLEWGGNDNRHDLHWPVISEWVKFNPPAEMVIAPPFLRARVVMVWP